MESREGLFLLTIAISASFYSVGSRLIERNLVMRERERLWEQNTQAVVERWFQRVASQSSKSTSFIHHDQREGRDTRAVTDGQIWLKMTRFRKFSASDKIHRPRPELSMTGQKILQAYKDQIYWGYVAGFLTS